jgi:hypothetical protein
VTEPIAPVTSSIGPSGEPGWGTPPQTLPEEPHRPSLTGALWVLLVMFGWLLIVFGLGAVVARNDPNVETPVEVNLGVVVTPADGWYSAAGAWDVGTTGIALQKSGVYVAFWVAEYRGTNDELMKEVLEELKPGFDSFSALPPYPVTIAGDLSGLVVHFTGITDWGQEENELVVLSYQGISVVMMAEALVGQLGWVQGDIDTMLTTLDVPR